MTPAAAGAGDAEDAALRLERFDHRRLARPLKKRLPDALLFDATDGFALAAVRSSVGGSLRSSFPFPLATRTSLRSLLKSHASKLSCPLRWALPSLRLTPPIAD
jgi:hypothetical protein